MKQKILKLFLFSLVVLMPLYTAKASSKLQNDIEEGLKTYLGSDYKDRIKKNTESTESILKIEELIKESSNSTLSIDDNGVEEQNLDYPSYIGGFYVDNETEKVVIQIVGNNAPTKFNNESNLYDKILSVNGTAEIKYVNNLLNEINDVIDILSSYYKENYADGYIDGYYDDIINNRVVVELNEYSDDSINEFKRNVIDSDIIYFTSSSNTVEYSTTTYAPGQMILPLGCSIGFRAKLNSAIGFVTAGHCVSGVGQSVATFGTVKKYQYKNNIDASWIDLDAQYIMGKYLKYIPSIKYGLEINNTPVTNIVVGGLYGKSGASSEYTYGKITSLNTSGANGITGIIKSSIYAKGGDSGGIVFKITGTGSAPTSYQTAGIVHGGDLGGGNMRFIKASNVVSKFGLTTY